VSGGSRALPPGLGPALARALGVIARADGAVLAGLALLVAITAATGLPVVAHGIALIALVLLATAVHELGHLVAYRMLAPHGRAVFAYDGMRGALTREPLPRRRDRAVTAAGPLAPLVLALCATPLAALFPAEVVGAGIIAVGHLLGLALPTADRRAWREAAPSPNADPAPTLGA